jgi:hypothetical protein
MLLAGLMVWTEFVKHFPFPIGEWLSSFHFVKMCAVPKACGQCIYHELFCWQRHIANNNI